MITKTCPVCGKKIDTYPSVNSVCCSTECAGKYKTKPRGKCLICTNPTSRITTKFCSWECYGKWRKGKERPSTYKRVAKKCLICGKEFWIHRWEDKIAQKILQGENVSRNQRRRRGLYCSAICVGLSLRKSFDEHYSITNSANWRDLRIKILERDKHRCQFCGVKENRDGHKSNLEVHHIIPKEKEGTKHAPPNLILLCSRCHFAITILNETGYKNIPNYNPTKVIQKFKIK